MVVAFFDDLVIFFHFKVSRVDPGAEFLREAVAAGNLIGVSEEQPLLSCYPEKRRSQPYLGEIKASSYRLLLPLKNKKAEMSRYENHNKSLMYCTSL